MFKDIIEIGSMLVALGAVYGKFSIRMKTLEDKLKQHENLSDRLIRIETKVEMILSKF